MDLIANLLKPDPGSASGVARQLTNQRIYTTGYEGREVTDLPVLLNSLDAVLVDIRFSPGERPLKWRKDYLKLLLKKRYLHIPSLGNRHQPSPEKIAIQNLALGIKIITELKVNVLLMCECKTEASCHRRAIAEELRKQGIRADEIEDWCLDNRVR
jgi:uncharacterized protein (DUF488 family)